MKKIFFAFIHIYAISAYSMDCDELIDQKVTVVGKDIIIQPHTSDAVICDPEMTEKEFDINKDYPEITPLLYASNTLKSVELTELLLKHGADVNLQYLGWSPFHYACYFGTTAMIETFILHGASLYTANKQGTLPLHLTMKRPEDPVKHTEAFLNAVQKKKNLQKIKALNNNNNI